MPILFSSGVLVPAPFVNMSKAYIKDEAGRILGSDYTFNLTGTIANWDDGLDSPGSIALTQMEGVLAEQTRIRNLFQAQSGLLQIKSPQLITGGIQAYCTVESLNFNPGTWVNRCDYTIVLKSKGIEGGSDPYFNLASRSENWSVTENPDATYSINHQIQARGIQTYQGGVANNPLNDAKAWVNSKSYTPTTLGILTENIAGSGTMDLSTLINPLPVNTNYWNKTTVESVNPTTFDYGLNEQFIYNPSGSFRNEFNIGINYQNNPAFADITINGSVVGFANLNNNFTLKYNNALTNYNTTISHNLFILASAYAPVGYTVSANSSSRQVTHEPFGGAVRYSAVFPCVLGGTYVSGSIVESITVIDSGSDDIFATIPIPGRAAGGLIQYMYTKTLPERSISIQATIGGSGLLGVANLRNAYLAKPNTDNLISALVPSSGYYFLRTNTEEYSVTRRQYSRNVSWVLANVSGVNGMPSIIHNVPA